MAPVRKSPRQHRAKTRRFIGAALIACLPGLCCAQEPAADAPGEQRRFDIWEYRVEGNTVLPAKTIESTVYPYLGPQRLVTDIDAAANSLERAYRDAGYPTIFVAVPEQDVVGGVVRLQILEGRIDRVRVEGARYFTPSGIRAGLPSLQHGEVLHVPSMQSELSALNSASPDRKITPVLKPGRTPGMVDVDLKVRDERPLHGSLDLNNYNSVNTSETRLTTALSYDNLWQRQHSFAMQWQISPQRLGEVNVLSATYVLPWFDTDNRFALYVIDSHSDVASVGDINVIGDGRTYGARLVVPMPSTQRLVQSFSAGLDYKDSSEIIRLDPQNKIDTPIDYAVWSLQYNATQFSAKAQTQWTVGANFGIRGAFNDDKVFHQKRFRSNANFAYLRAAVERLDYLPADWQLGSRLAFQVTDEALINNEQLSAGGDHSVRGYYESQALGDSGAIAGLELRTPVLLPKAEVVNTLRLLAFLEGARLRTRDALPDQDNNASLASVGLGFQGQFWRRVDVSFDWAWLLIDNGTVERFDQRAHMRLLWKF